MKNLLPLSALLLATLALPLAAQDWGVRVATGPFVFGDLLERTLRPGNEQGSQGPHTLTLSAATRAGLAVDIERSLSDRWAVRAEGTFTRSPLTVRQTGQSDGVELDAGELDISTFTLPIVFRINQGGTFRFHVMAGPALAFYRLNSRENSTGAEPAFDGTQSEWGLVAGAGAAWWLSDRFAIEGQLSDVVTSSPIDRSDLPDVPGIDIPRPHNVHTTIGLRWKF